MKLNIKILLGTLMVVGMSLLGGCGNQTPAKSPAEQKISCEMKFLLNADKVLTDQRDLKPEYKQLFNIKDKYKKIEMLFVDTLDKDFNKQGWFNRIRMKKAGQRLELTYKKRILIEKENVQAALATAAKEGLTLQDKACEFQIDWSYEKMYLSPAYVKAAPEGVQELKLLTVEKARQFLKEEMPASEINAGTANWGIDTLGKTHLAGPVTSYGYRGTYEGEKIGIEIMNLKSAEAPKPIYIVELSCKVKDYHQAKALKEKMTKALDREQILKHGDSLKTQLVLDTYLKEKEL